MQSIDRVLIAIALVALIIISGWQILKIINTPNPEDNYPGHDSSVKINATAAPFFAASFPDIQGNPIALKQWQGKTLVVNFWATWCPPCREEMPELSQLQEKYKDSGVVVIGISTDDLAKTREFSLASPVSYLLLAGDMQAMSLGENLGNNQEVLPYTVIIKADGTIANTHFGRINQTLLEEALLPLINTSGTDAK